METKPNSCSLTITTLLENLEVIMETKMSSSVPNNRYWQSH